MYCKVHNIDSKNTGLQREQAPGVRRITSSISIRARHHFAFNCRCTPLFQELLMMATFLSRRGPRSVRVVDNSEVMFNLDCVNESALTEKESMTTAPLLSTTDNITFSLFKVVTYVLCEALSSTRRLESS